MKIGPCRVVVAAACLLAFVERPAFAGTVIARAPDLTPGTTWTMHETREGAALPVLEAGWDARTFWDLRPFYAVAGRRVTWSIRTPAAAGLAAAAQTSGADRALCASLPDGGDARPNCTLIHARADNAARATETARVTETGRVAEAERADDTTRPDGTAWSAPMELGAGSRYTARERSGDVDGSIEGRGVAEGIALVPAGPQEIVLVREVLRGGGAPARLRYRFLTRAGFVAASIEGPLPASARGGTSAAGGTIASGGGAVSVGTFVPDHAAVLVSITPRASNGLTIPYAGLHRALTPGRTGAVQFSSSQTLPLTTVNPAWTSVAAMIAPGSTNVAYQPDPGDPSSSVVLPEVWDFAPLQQGSLDSRTFISVRNELAGASCLESCSTRDLGATPADGTWQEWLKIDRFTAAGAYGTRDVFLLNDNDTGANPSIDVPYVAQDELNVSDHTQICFQGSAGGASRLLRFFRFTGADPSSAVMKMGDTWSSGAWTSCSDGAGLRLTLASVCGDQCYPGCSTLQPRARGMFAAGAGFVDTVVEDGYVHVAAGNYIPALLMRQDTDLQAGRNLLGTCNVGTVRNRSFDYFWVQEHYGYLALVSSPTDATGTLPPDDWSSVGNQTDGVDVAWGPFPPYQVDARACLAGTRVGWTLPADGSHPGSAPGVGDWGYVVSWGADNDPEALADWSANPNHTPLPGEAGYLAAPPGLEPTSTVIGGWPGSSINVTVVTALRYTDPTIGDVRPYRSAALFKVVEDPARLDPAAFQVGNGVNPFVTRSGDDLLLSWPAVPGAASYVLRVWDLDTRLEISCPAGLDCAPAAPQAIHAGGAVAAANLGYRVFAVDPCGAASAN